MNTVLYFYGYIKKTIFKKYFNFRFARENKKG